MYTKIASAHRAPHDGQSFMHISSISLNEPTHAMKLVPIDGWTFLIDRYASSVALFEIEQQGPLAGMTTLSATHE